MLLSTPPLSERDRTRAYAAHAEMPAISDLKRLGSSFPDGRCVLGGAISADDFHRGMVFKPGRNSFYRAIRQHIDGFTAFQIADQRSVAQSAFPGSGKGNGVAAIPSPKNWTSEFPHIQLKPFSPPVSPDAVSLRVNPGCELVDGRLGEATPDFLPDPILLLTALTHDGCAIR
jgi:hypothetical protein